MRVLLIDKETKLFYGGCGRWVKHPERALAYPDLDQVHRLVSAEARRFQPVLTGQMFMAGEQQPVWQAKAAA